MSTEMINPYFTAAHGFGGVYAGRARSAGSAEGVSAVHRGPTASGMLGAGNIQPNIQWGTTARILDSASASITKAAAGNRSRSQAFSGMYSAPSATEGRPQDHLGLEPGSMHHGVGSIAGAGPTSIVTPPSAPAPQVAPLKSRLGAFAQVMAAGPHR